MANENPEARPDDSALQMRKITDAQTLRALSHPVRIALIEELSLNGPMTATEVGERIGESPTTCSFHLRQLAKYDFVEEAGGGKGRARPWKMRSLGMSFSTEDSDPAAQLAGTVAARMFRERQMERYRAWQDSKQSYPSEWRRAADETQAIFYLTAAELTALNQDLRDIVMHRFPERLTDPSLRPAGAVPVELMLLTYPVEMPDQEG
jgi:DNA-binding transcriptional ArsR family regulator